MIAALGSERLDRLFELAGLEGNEAERSRLGADLGQIEAAWSALERESPQDHRRAILGEWVLPRASEGSTPRRVDRVDARETVVLPLEPCPSSPSAPGAALVHRYVEPGHEGGPLSGLRYATKANIAVRGHPHDCCSRLLEGYASPYDATVTVRLREAGATLIGATNMDEFAMGSSTRHSCHGPTENPLDASRSVGGSSGGAAALVASGEVDFALGSDTGGSVRLPAACCGVWGLRPTWGRVSRYGLTAFACSMDQIGPLARDARTLRRVFEVLRGRDARDATSYEPDTPPDPDAPVCLLVDEGLRGASSPEIADAFDWAVGRLRGAGWQLRVAPSFDAWPLLECYYALSSVEASSNLARFDGMFYGRRFDTGVGESVDFETVRRWRSRGFGDEVKRRILGGLLSLTSERGRVRLASALATRVRIRRAYERVLENGSIVLSPTLLTWPRADDHPSPLDEWTRDRATVGASLAGLPALSLPFHAPGGAPLGLQLTGGRDQDEALLEWGRRIADCLEAAG